MRQRTWHPRYRDSRCPSRGRLLGLLNLRIAVDRLRAANFYVAPEVLKHLLKDLP
jgi:hypothetical protein